MGHCVSIKSTLSEPENESTWSTFTPDFNNWPLPVERTNIRIRRHEHTHTQKKGGGRRWGQGHDCSPSKSYCARNAICKIMNTKHSREQLEQNIPASTVALALFTACSTRAGSSDAAPPGSLSFLFKNFPNATALFVAKGPPGCANLSHHSRKTTPLTSLVNFLSLWLLRTIFLHNPNTFNLNIFNHEDKIHKFRILLHISISI